MTAPDPVDVPPAPSSAVLCAAWASPADVPESRRDLLSNEQWERVLMIASEILFYLSGSQWFGQGCTETVTLRSRPPAPGTASWPYSRTWGHCSCWSSGVISAGYLYPPPPGVWVGTHLSPMAVRLPRQHVTVTSVTLNGQPFTDYRVNGAGWLERTDGRAWSVCDDTTEVEYTFGAPPPVSGIQAAVELAVELALAQVGDSACRLPKRVQTVTRQGISITMLDAQEFLKEGRTGLYFVDLFLITVNPAGLRRNASVWSPDLPTA
jgi:hypothetical protein